MRPVAVSPANAQALLRGWTRFMERSEQAATRASVPESHDDAEGSSDPEPHPEDAVPAPTSPPA